MIRKLALVLALSAPSQALKEPLIAWLGVHSVLATLAESGKVNK